MPCWKATPQEAYGAATRVVAHPQPGRVLTQEATSVGLATCVAAAAGPSVGLVLRA